VDREKFDASVARVEELVLALAGTEHVSSYTRTSSTGKTVHVGAYTRDPGEMSNTDLFKEYKALSGGTSGLPDTQKRSRMAAVVQEIAARKDRGEWGHTRKSDATQAANRVNLDDTGHSTKDDFNLNREIPKGEVSDAEYDAHVEQVRAILKDPKYQKFDTQRMHGVMDPETGKPIPGLYSPERTEQHIAIIEDILKKHANVPTEKKAIMSGGLGGAGKGYVLKKHAGVNQDDYLTIDPDEMKQELLKRGMVPEIPGLLPMEHAFFMHEESSDLANLLHQVAMSKGMNVILDTTMASVGSTQKKVNKFLDKGYDVEGIFVDVPIHVSQDSALGRHRGGVNRFRAGDTEDHGEFGGRFVPPEYIAASAPPEGSPYNSKNREAFEEMKKMGLFSRTRVYDNSDRRKAEDGGSGPRAVSDETHTRPPKTKKKPLAPSGPGTKPLPDPSKATARALNKVGLSAPTLPAVERLLKLTSVR
jgi:predicted kinase